MAKQFYSHIIEIDTLYIELDSLEASEKEKDHLKHLVDTSMYHTIMDIVLSELPEEDKKMFLEKLADEDHEKTIDFLKKRVLNIEEKIKRKAKELVEELKEDIKEIKSR